MPDQGSSGMCADCDHFEIDHVNGKCFVDDCVCPKFVVKKTGSTLTIQLMNGAQEYIRFGDGEDSPREWRRTATGLVIKWNKPGVWREYPWASIAYIENTPPED